MSQQLLTTSRIGLPFFEKKTIPQNTRNIRIFRLFKSEFPLFRGTEKAQNSVPYSEPFTEKKVQNSVPNLLWNTRSSSNSRNSNNC
jgi:hypothetical protein